MNEIICVPEPVLQVLAGPCSSLDDLSQRFPFISIIDSLMASNDDVRELLAWRFSAIDRLLKNHTGPGHSC